MNQTSKVYRMSFKSGEISSRTVDSDFLVVRSGRGIASLIKQMQRKRQISHRVKSFEAQFQIWHAEGAGLSLQYFKKAIPTNKDTWPPGSSLLGHQHPYASSHHRQKFGGRNYKCRELSENVERLKNELHLEHQFQEVEKLYREFLEEIIHEMSEDVMKNAEDMNAPENPLQFLPQAWDKDTYHTSEAKLLDYERVRFSSEAQNPRIQPTSPMREVVLTATGEEIGTESPESPNFERVDYGDDSRAGKLQIPAPSGPPEDEENALNPYKQKGVVGIRAKPKEKRQEDCSHRDECTTRSQAQDVTADVEPITSVEVLKSQFQIPMRSTGYLRVPDLELQLNWHIAHPIKESADSTETSASGIPTTKKERGNRQNLFKLLKNAIESRARITNNRSPTICCDICSNYIFHC
ncbi:hypothetical protein B0H13DRAFT_1851356 [Mycena leptocephala]|nr:hypothetical protein B0H13DRAFT_1851356 [Mycena leptocephala]